MKYDAYKPKYTLKHLLFQNMVHFTLNTMSATHFKFGTVTSTCSTDLKSSSPFKSPSSHAYYLIYRTMINFGVLKCRTIWFSDGVIENTFLPLNTIVLE